MLKYALNIRASEGEETHLAECLQSVLDTIGDKLTQVVISIPHDCPSLGEIASIPNSKIIQYTWNKDFAAMRNHLLKHTSEDIDYILWLDPDERINKTEKKVWDELVTVVEQTKHKAYNLDMIMLGKDNKTPQLTFSKTKLFSRKDAKWMLPVHEDLDIIHRTNIAGCRVYHMHDKDDSEFKSLRRNIEYMTHWMDYGNSKDRVEHTIVKGLLLRDSYLLSIGEGDTVRMLDLMQQIESFVLEKESDKSIARVYGTIADLSLFVAKHYLEPELGKPKDRRNLTQIEKGETYLRISMTIDPNSPVYYYYLGEIAQSKGIGDVAKDMYTKSLTNTASKRGTTTHCSDAITRMMPALRLAEIYLQEKDVYNFLQISSVALSGNIDINIARNILTARKKLLDSLSKENKNLLKQCN